MTTSRQGADFLAELRREREAFLRHLDGLPPESLEEPLEPGGWTARQLLAHLESADRFVLEAMRLTAAGRTHEIPQFATDEEGDEWNRQQLEARRAWSVAEALARARSARQELEQELTALEEGLLDTPVGKRRLRDIIAVDTYEHDREHAPLLARWRAARSA